MDLFCALGVFFYDECSSDAVAKSHREIDIEFSHWSQPADPGVQFVVQPFRSPGHTQRFALSQSLQPGKQTLTMVIDWSPRRVHFAVIRGIRILADLASTPSELVEESWTFSNASAIPDPGLTKFHVNAWVQAGVVPASPSPIVFNILDFQFSPSNSLFWEP
jgi:hypothetical protein